MREGTLSRLSGKERGRERIVVEGVSFRVRVRLSKERGGRTVQREFRFSQVVVQSVKSRRHALININITFCITDRKEVGVRALIALNKARVARESGPCILSGASVRGGTSGVLLEYTEVEVT